MVRMLVGPTLLVAEPFLEMKPGALYTFDHDSYLQTKPFWAGHVAGSATSKDILMFVEFAPRGVITGWFSLLVVAGEMVGWINCPCLTEQELQKLFTEVT